jgi:hypothetical protein
LVSLFEFLERIESAWKFSLIIILENDLASEHISVFLQNWDAPHSDKGQLFAVHKTM